MTLTDHTPSQPRTADGAATPLPAAADNAAVAAARRQSTGESYRIAASLAHRPGS